MFYENEFDRFGLVEHRNGMFKREAEQHRGQYNCPTAYKQTPDKVRPEIRPMATLGTAELVATMSRSERSKFMRNIHNTRQWPCRAPHRLSTLPKNLRYVAEETVKPAPLTKRQQQLLRRKERKLGIN